MSTESFSLNVKIATPEGDDEVEIKITYPKGRATSGVQGFYSLAKQMPAKSLLYMLRDDPSVQEFLRDHGVEFAGEEDDE